MANINLFDSSAVTDSLIDIVRGNERDIFVGDTAPTTYGNFVTWSQVFNSHWNKNLSSNITVTDNTYTAPDSTTTAAQFVATATSAGVYSNPLASTGLPGGLYTFSVYYQYQSGATNWLVGTDAANIVVNTQTGAFVSQSAGVVSYEIDNIGSGWYRYSVTFNITVPRPPNTNTGTNPALTIYSENGASSSTIAVWGAQAQYANAATTYVATSGSQIFLPADVLNFDAEEVYLINVSDSSTVTDALTHYVDEVFVTESIQVEIVEEESLFDSSTVTDVLNQMLEIHMPQVSDSSTVTDVPTMQIPIYYINVEDDSAVTDVLVEEDVLEVNVSDSSTVTDVLPINPLVNPYWINVSDSSTVTESFTVSASPNVIISESSTVTDVLTVAPLTIPVVLSDSPIASDFSNVAQVYIINVSDSSTVTDVLVQEEDILEVNVNDSSNVNDGLTGQNNGIYLNPLDLILSDTIGPFKLILVDGQLAIQVAGNIYTIL